MCFRSERISVEWSQTKSSLEPQRLIKRMQKILKQCNAGEQRKKINKHKQTLKRKKMRLNESWLVSVLHSQKRQRTQVYETSHDKAKTQQAWTETRSIWSSYIQRH